MQNNHLKFADKQTTKMIIFLFFFFFVNSTQIILPPDSNALVKSFGSAIFVFDVNTSEISDKVVKFNKLLDTLLSVHDVIDDIVL